MIISGAFDSVDVLKTAADYSWKRNEVLNNNIANVDTPGYKREDVSFSTCLEAQLDADKKGLSKTFGSLRSSQLDNVEFMVYKDYSGMSYRLDGNNVDIETENVELASNQLYYNGLVDSMSSEFSRIRTAIGK